VLDVRYRVSKQALEISRRAYRGAPRNTVASSHDADAIIGVEAIKRKLPSRLVATNEIQKAKACNGKSANDDQQSQ
jgi:hypothetical protein